MPSLVIFEQAPIRKIAYVTGGKKIEKNTKDKFF